MREIVADLASEAPRSLDLDEWEMFCARVTEAELADVSARNWLELSTEHRAGSPLVIPADIEADPRLDSVDRFVLAALADVARNIDTTRPEAREAVCLRLFGPRHDAIDRAAVWRSLARMTSLAVLSATVSGGFVRRAS